MTDTKRSVWIDESSVKSVEYTLKNEQSESFYGVKVHPRAVPHIRSKFLESANSAKQFSLRQMNSEPFKEDLENAVFVVENEFDKTPQFGVSIPISDFVTKGVFNQSLYNRLQQKATNSYTSDLFDGAELLNLLYIPTLDKGIFRRQNAEQQFGLYNLQNTQIESHLSDLTIRGVPDSLLVELLSAKYPAELFAEVI